MYGQWDPGHLKSNAIICSTSISLAKFFFFKCILSGKNWRSGGELLSKMILLMIVPTYHVIAMAGLTLGGGPRHFENFGNIFQPNISEDQKKSYHLSAVPLAHC